MSSWPADLVEGVTPLDVVLGVLPPTAVEVQHVCRGEQRADVGVDLSGARASVRDDDDLKGVFCLSGFRKENGQTDVVLLRRKKKT